MNGQLNNDLQKARIASAYGLCDNPNITKAGEGSRGGKVIGHTKSGKPIYDSFNHPEHKNFTKEDHADAADTHSPHNKTNQQSYTKTLNQHDKHRVAAGLPGHFKETRDKQKSKLPEDKHAEFDNLSNQIDKDKFQEKRPSMSSYLQKAEGLKE